MQEIGHEVVVIEATDHVGGRLLSETLSDGTVVELGGEWITTDQTHVTALANDLGLSLIPTGSDFSMRDLGIDSPLSAAEHNRVAAIVAAAIAGLTVAEMAGKTAKDLLDGVDDGSEAMTALRLRIEGSAALNLARVGASELVGDFGVASAAYVRIEGGNQRLAIEAAKRLSNIRFMSPVTAIHTRDSFVELRTASTAIQADGVVIAVPLPLLRSITFDPPLPEPTTEAISRLQMGIASKIAAATATDPPLLARQHPSEPWWYWTALGGDGFPRRVVTAFGGTDASATKQADSWFSELATLVDDTRLTGESVHKSWGTDEWTRGCYTALGPGDEELLAAFEAVDRFVFAGEHTGGWGSIDGAVLSGHEAAERLNRFLSM